MSAELVDPFATPERLKPADMCEDITARLPLDRFDPTLLTQLVNKTLHELRRAADGELRGPLDLWARALLEQLHHRAVTGVEFDEPREPAWSLDSEWEVPR